MHSKFPFSMEKIPRQKSFVCLSLKFGCVVSALIIILYSVLSLAQCTAAISELTPSLRPDDLELMMTYGLIIVVSIVHAVTLFLTAVMLVGTLREKSHWMRPWVIWTSIQVMTYVLLFVLWTTMNMINHFADNSLLEYTIEFMTLLVRFYMLTLVSSYYKQLEEERFDGERLKTLVSTDTWYSSA